MTTALDELYEAALAHARADDRVLGLVLHGSRARGLANEWSDYDVELVVVDGAEAAIEARYTDAPAGWDLWATSLPTMRAMPLGPVTWIRRSYLRLSPVLDKTGGELQRVIDEIWHVPEAAVAEYVQVQLDAYSTAVLRSIKNLRAGDVLAHRLDAAASIEPMLASVFAMHERRLAPLPKYLRWDLERFPLTGLSCTSDELLDGLLAILDRGDVATQQRLLADVQELARRSGHGAAFEITG